MQKVSHLNQIHSDMSRIADTSDNKENVREKQIVAVPLEKSLPGSPKVDKNRNCRNQNKRKVSDSTQTQSQSQRQSHDKLT